MSEPWRLMEWLGNRQIPGVPVARDDCYQIRHAGVRELEEDSVVAEDVERLVRLDAQQAQVGEFSFLAGLSPAKAGGALSVSQRAVGRPGDAVNARRAGPAERRTA